MMTPCGRRDGLPPASLASISLHHLADVPIRPLGLFDDDSLDPGAWRRPSRRYSVQGTMIGWIAPAHRLWTIAHCNKWLQCFI
jgi:hypothetical protein